MDATVKRLIEWLIKADEYELRIAWELGTAKQVKEALVEFFVLEQISIERKNVVARTFSTFNLCDNWLYQYGTKEDLIEQAKFVYRKEGLPFLFANPNLKDVLIEVYKGMYPQVFSEFFKLLPVEYLDVEILSQMIEWNPFLVSDDIDKVRQVLGFDENIPEDWIIKAVVKNS